MTAVPLLTKDHAPQIGVEVDEALTALLRQDPTTVWQFQETFYLRSVMAGLTETHKGSVGIKGTLAELFSGRFSLESVFTSMRKEVPDERFVAEFRDAIQLLAKEEPLPLLFIKRNQQRNGCLMEEALQAVLACYSRRARVLPY